MKDRIRQIMESQHMTQQVFAQFIEMSPASLSSIFNGRTKPTLNVVEAIKKKIPDISVDWLMFGSGQMYVSKSPIGDHAMASDAGGQPLNSGEQLLDFSDAPAPAPSIQLVGSQENRASAASNFNSVRSTHPVASREEVKKIDKPLRRVTEIRVFYDDQTWESFIPAKK